MTRHPRICARLTVATVVATAVLAACGGAPATPAASPTPRLTQEAHEATGSPGSSPVAEAAAPCDLINAGIAAAFIGAPVFDARPGDIGDGRSCLFAATDGGPGTAGLTIGAAAAGPGLMAELARQVPEATPATGPDGVLATRGAAWFVLSGHLVSVVLVEVSGRPAPPETMRSLVRAILERD